jgi:hypothetical protein
MIDGRHGLCSQSLIVSALAGAASAPETKIGLYNKHVREEGENLTAILEKHG